MCIEEKKINTSEHIHTSQEKWSTIRVVCNLLAYEWGKDYAFPRIAPMFQVAHYSKQDNMATGTGKRTRLLQKKEKLDFQVKPTTQEWVETLQRGRKRSQILIISSH